MNTQINYVKVKELINQTIGKFRRLYPYRSEDKKIELVCIVINEIRKDLLARLRKHKRYRDAYDELMEKKK